MKKIAFVVLAVSLLLSGVTLAQQSGEEKKGTSMKYMMQEMMKGGQEGEHMGGMMRMMKMMEQCSAMMEAHHQGEKSKESQNK